MELSVSEPTVGGRGWGASSSRIRHRPSATSSHSAPLSRSLRYRFCSRHFTALASQLFLVAAPFREHSRTRQFTPLRRSDPLISVFHSGRVALWPEAAWQDGHTHIALRQQHPPPSSSQFPPKLNSLEHRSLNSPYVVSYVFAGHVVGKSLCPGASFLWSAGGRFVRSPWEWRTQIGLSLGRSCPMRYLPHTEQFRHTECSITVHFSSTPRMGVDTSVQFEEGALGTRWVRDTQLVTTSFYVSGEKRHVGMSKLNCWVRVHTRGGWGETQPPFILYSREHPWTVQLPVGQKRLHTILSGFRKILPWGVVKY